MKLRTSLAGVAVVLALVGCAELPAPTASRLPDVSITPATATLAASAPVETPSATPATTVASVPASGTAAALLAVLRTRSSDSLAGYNRDLFGPAWADVDRNGCDTRNDILKRDLANETFSGSCTVLTGRLVSAYTGATLSFVRGTGTSTAVQIDHVVALADAWRSGASGLTANQRQLLANDPLNLQAIEGPLNASKSDMNAAQWLPPLSSYRCTYVARQISVKYWYGLSVTSAERSAMTSVLASCPNQAQLRSTLVTSPLTPAGTTPTTTPTPVVPTPVTPPAPVSYANCAAVRAAGKAPLRVGQPGYSRSLDRDGDGIACE